MFLRLLDGKQELLLPVTAYVRIKTIRQLSARYKLLVIIFLSKNREGSTNRD